MNGIGHSEYESITIDRGKIKLNFLREITKNISYNHYYLWESKTNEPFRNREELRTTCRNGPLYKKQTSKFFIKFKH